ncbi:hypothetical protein BD289DRAFT_22776 [Coniella lustricola]|uniref:Uncharacterized protein n=1 Tax=Coniella lustricola TaxID=2025994 RepID=A0A2T3A3I4_9PEZI|nr:hypothetical protein BD289DRAFT_22776 [Coniella lustricola]
MNKPCPYGRLTQKKKLHSPCIHCVTLLGQWACTLLLFPSSFSFFFCKNFLRNGLQKKPRQNSGFRIYNVRAMDPIPIGGNGRAVLTIRSHGEDRLLFAPSLVEVGALQMQSCGSIGQHPLTSEGRGMSGFAPPQRNHTSIHVHGCVVCFVTSAPAGTSPIR